jgi:alpha-N-arabinofuranosidase
MTGLERNADMVRMASYAPLFANVDAWQWTPDLIWVDSLQVYGTPNYYVQQLFSRNRGDVVLPTQLGGTGAPASTAPRLYATAARDDQTHEIILKVVNPENTAADVEINLAGVNGVEPGADCIVLSGAGPEDVNSFNEPMKISPVESKLDGVAPQFGHSFPPYSLTVLRLKAQ